jgi:hypothetical protein
MSHPVCLLYFLLLPFPNYHIFIYSNYVLLNYLDKVLIVGRQAFIFAIFSPLINSLNTIYTKVRQEQTVMCSLI